MHGQGSNSLPQWAGEHRQREKEKDQGPLFLHQEKKLTFLYCPWNILEIWSHLVSDHVSIPYCPQIMSIHTQIISFRILSVWFSLILMTLTLSLNNFPSWLPCSSWAVNSDEHIHYAGSKSILLCLIVVLNILMILAWSYFFFSVISNL